MGTSLSLGHLETIPKVSDFGVLGTRVAHEDTAPKVVAHRLGKAWAAFFVHRPPLCNRRLPMVARYKVFRSVLTATCMWGLEAIRLTLRQRKTLSVAHLSLVSRMLQLQRNRFPTWVVWCVERRRRARGRLNRRVSVRGEESRSFRS